MPLTVSHLGCVVYFHLIVLCVSCFVTIYLANPLFGFSRVRSNTYSSRRCAQDYVWLNLRPSAYGVQLAEPFILLSLLCDLLCAHQQSIGHHRPAHSGSIFRVGKRRSNINRISCTSSSSCSNTTTSISSNNNHHPIKRIPMKVCSDRWASKYLSNAAKNYLSLSGWHRCPASGFVGFVVHRSKGVPTLSSMHEPLVPARIRQAKEKTNNDSKAEERGMHTMDISLFSFVLLVPFTKSLRFPMIRVTSYYNRVDRLI